MKLKFLLNFIKMKQYISGDWKFFLDPKNEGINKKIFQVKDIKNSYSSLNTVKVPSSWNSNPKLERYEGHCWYFKAFEIPEFDINNYDLFLTFNGVNYSSKIWLNSKLISVHEGGFLPFKIKIAPDIINFNDINYLAVRVDNIRKKDGIPGLLFDWYNWGGIIRDVYYEILPKNRFDYIFITSKIGDGKATLNCKYKITKSSDFYYQLKFHDEIVQTGNINITTPNGCFKIILNSPELWSPETPNLYSLDFSIKNNANYKYSLRFGVREIKTKGSYLYLNNKRIKLFGINLHEELVPYGRSIPTDLRRRDLLSIKNLGFNALRTAHYPHDEILLDLTDEIGLLVLEEIPVYWNIAFKNPKTFKLAANMIHDLIFRDFNHPSVILWSVGNEIPIVLPHCNKFILNLVQYAKKLDSSRLITYVSFHVLSDSYRRKTDIATLNEYFGWYLLSEKNLNFILELTRFMSLCHNKPWFITEFGAGAKIPLKFLILKIGLQAGLFGFIEILKVH